MFTRFLDDFSDEDLAIVWKYGGMGWDEDARTDAPFPGREGFAEAFPRFLLPVRGRMRAVLRPDEAPKFLQPILTPLRDLLRRAVRKMGTRAKLSMLRALLRAIVFRYVPPVPNPAPTPRILTAQRRYRRIAPARAP